MSTMAIGNGHGKASKKRKKNYASPFRIKVGCLVALRYRPRGNQVSVLMPDGDPSTSSGVEEERYKLYPERVASAHFSEVWTDPRRGRDDGLALIGSRIRCFFPKAILSEPHNAVSRLLEGTVVNVVRVCEDQSTSKQQFSSEPSSFMVDLLVDNEDDKTLSVKLPFLKRLDNDGQSDPAGKILKESELRRRQYEERIKGGKHKAVVRISLSNSSFSDSVRMGGNPLEAKWVIRKRVPTKIIRREIPVPIVIETPTGTIDGKDTDEVKEKTVISNNDTIKMIGNTDITHSGENGGKFCEDSNEIQINDEKKTIITSPTSQALSDSVKKKWRKRELDTHTSFNKDFSLPRYLGDGNDSTAQQEGNWRWEAGRYHNPYHAALADRPISKTLLEKLSYNFAGEVISIHPVQPQRTKNPSVDTLAMVTIRLMVLPEHTHSGRLAHHGPFDLFESDDLEVNKLLLEGEQKDNNIQHRSNISEKQQSLVDGNTKNGNNLVPRCFLRVPIEELVIVERKIYREYLGSNKNEEIEKGQNEMAIQHSYSFLNDSYSRCEEERRVSENLDDKVEQEKSGSQICRRCRHLSVVTKRLAGVPHLLCERCFDFLKQSDAARCGIYQKSKSKKYRCDCYFCVDRNHTDLLVGLAAEVLESESKLGSTLNELEDYSAHRDSGFIATRFITKGMNPVDFSISPSSLASFINSASSKPVTKIKIRVSKGTKRPTAMKSGRASSNMNGPKRNDYKSPARQGEKRSFSTRDHGSLSTVISKNEPFRPTSSRLLPFDVPNRRFDVSAAKLYQWKIFRSSNSAFPEKPRNLRQYEKLEKGGDFVGDDSVKKKLQGRAARAKQRRLLRGVSALGVNVDTLAGRETNIRFDRSDIHGWGVFTDIDIRQGEMIIEYRGELISNAMAEKREKEYESAKIGSDYMFRIDEYTVCDASKHGNVARFINASCTPNCYPKIIFLDGMKRVVVYAKRDIRAGEELCYDYKFDIEYDPAKRIPCICGAPDCRGFLNWDQRYVALPNDATNADSGSKNK
jgi:hypothetical protein